ncbi:hypothetical protein AAFF_G00381370 [Aldrovandia affinis]|uniref:Uncharacterized protein n=1 Tax=Aldrovandia affinis TaxID=143900 RepID=A0AAD7X0T8_9TELE|nr:hypothetical protein AAFF_G00381370 [Aldrovandia affinis]
MHVGGRESEKWVYRGHTVVEAADPSRKDARVSTSGQNEGAWPPVKDGDVGWAGPVMWAVSAAAHLQAAGHWGDPSFWLHWLSTTLSLLAARPGTAAVSARGKTERE